MIETLVAVIAEAHGVIDLDIDPDETEDDGEE